MSTPYNFKFKELHTFENRLAESTRICQKYPDRVPIIIEVSNDLPKIDKSKFLVPQELTVGQFLHIIRKRIQITPDKAIFIFVNNTLPTLTSLISELQNSYRDSDGFLYMVCTGETVYGN